MQRHILDIALNIEISNLASNYLDFVQSLKKFMDVRTKKITFENFLRGLRWCEMSSLEDKLRGKNISCLGSLTTISL